MGQTFHVASYNIHKAIGGDRRRDPARCVEVLRELGADLIALQEVDLRFGTRRGVLDLQQLFDATGLRPLSLPERLKPEAHGWHGNLLLHGPQVQVRDVQVLDLPGLEPRGAVVSDLILDGRRLRVINTHLGLLRRSRRAQARRLASEIAPDGATLVMGDLNEWQRRAGGTFAALEAGLRVSAPAEHAPSFPARAPMVSLDRIMGCTQVSLGPVTAHNSATARRASDHLPVVAQLRFKD